LFKINIFLVFLDYFDVLISKIILKNKKIYYFDTFPNKKHLKNNRNHTLKHSLHLH
jgi:S-ribosylhomocysteine lyase LuxS involved in autoinducer biosynthesis